MKPTSITPFRALLVLCIAATCTAGPIRAAGIDFAHDIVPILKNQCSKCHMGAEKKGGLSMNTESDFRAGGENGTIATPGEGAKSLMIALLRSTDDDEWMPPKGDRVADTDIATLEAWVDAGMPWTPGFSFGTGGWEPPLKPRHVTLPAAVAGRTHPIDRLLDHSMEANKVRRPKPVDDAAFLRRATQDLTGLLPTPEDMFDFVRDTAPDKRTKKIETLLADNVAYADHWLTMWNDLLRNGYTGTGFITGGRKQITTWLYAALYNNTPYDQFVRELLKPDGPSAGFINGIKWRGEVNASQSLEIQFAQNVSQVFLGINMKCASCHDSFVDRWTLQEAYDLAAVYAQHPMELNRCDKPTGKMATPKWLFPELGEIDPNAAQPERLKQLGALMTHPENGRFTRTAVNRIWHRLMGRGIVHPVDAMHTKPWNEDLLDYLAVRFAKDGYDLRAFIRFVMTSEAYQSKSVIVTTEQEVDYVYRGPLAKRMTAEQLMDAVWQITETHPEKATANVTRVIQEKQPAPKAISPQPITATWIWHDGKGRHKAQLRKHFTLPSTLIKASVRATCDNAFTMKVNGVSVATSEDWNKPLGFDIAEHLQKGENTIEVDAEMFGGSAGFVCQIEFTANGKQVVLITDKSWEVRKPKGDWHAAVEVAPHGSQPWGPVLNGPTLAPGPLQPALPVRAALVKNDFLMRSLGRPNRDQVVTTRPSDLTTLQAIDLTNGEILAGYVRAGAQHVLKDKERSPDALVDWVFSYALSRTPTTGERNILKTMISDDADQRAVEDMLWTVFMLPEFQIVR
jgi:hypothetical protein